MYFRIYSSIQAMCHVAKQIQNIDKILSLYTLWEVIMSVTVSSILIYISVHGTGISTPLLLLTIP